MGLPITGASPRWTASSFSATSKADAYSHSDLSAMKKADDGIPRTVAPIEEIQLYVRDASGKRVDVSFQELVNKTMDTKLPRADLHISRTRDGELLLTSRQDGMIRMLVPDEGGSGSGKR